MSAPVQKVFTLQVDSASGLAAQIPGQGERCGAAGVPLEKLLELPAKIRIVPIAEKGLLQLLRVGINTSGMKIPPYWPNFPECFT